MLSAAEADLARRDSALPGLALVLDPDALTAALRPVLPAAHLRTAQITHIRYQPLSYCRVAYRLDVAGAEVVLVAWAGRPDALAARLDDHARPSPFGPVGPERLVLHHCAVVVTVFPDDLKL